MKGFNEEGKVLVYGEEMFAKNMDLVPVCTIIRDGIEYAIIDNKDEDTALCYPCVKATDDAGMINFMDPEADKYLKSSGKLVEFALE